MYRKMILVRFSIFVFALVSGRSLHAQNARETGLATATQLEEIYIARSVHESTTVPTTFCTQDRTGFVPLIGATPEGQYTFRSTITQASDGRMTEMNAKTIGTLHACFGASSDPTVFNFYGEGFFGHTPFKGIGDCHRRKADFPESGLSVWNCFLDLSGLPSEYVGGLLTTNTMNSRASLGMETNPSGYTQTSIATIRLWRKRAEH